MPVIKLHGSISSENAETVKKALLSELETQEEGAVILDAGELVYISSAGLRMLLQIRKKYPELSMINVSPEVYEILDTTGFTEILSVEKAYRSLSVEGCEVIGEGAKGKVYRIDRETVVKVYKSPDVLPEIRNERKVARLALILGIPTAISFDIVRVGDSYGAVYELLDAQSFSNILAGHPEKMDWCVREYVSMLKLIHSTAVPEGQLPSMNETAQGWVSRMKSCLSGAKGQQLQNMIDSVPLRQTMIHGDYHTNNIVLSGGEVMLIDMDTLSIGHPVFELAQMYCSFIGFYEHHSKSTEDFLGFDHDTAEEFWRRSLKAYLETEDENRIRRIEDEIRCIAYARLIDWSMRHSGEDDEEAQAQREYWKQQLEVLLDSEEAEGETETGEDSEQVIYMIRPLAGQTKNNGPVQDSGREKDNGGSSFETICDSECLWKTDLHMHTTVSDGTDTPEELLLKVKRAGIPIFSVTDHDSVRGCRIIGAALGEGDPLFIAGAEFSCRDDEGKYHILGYGYNPDSPSMMHLTELGHIYRMHKLHGRLDSLKKRFNITFPDEAVKKLYQMDNPGKPHLGNMMVKYGFAPTKESAIDKFLNKIHFDTEYIEPEEAVIGILAGGGIPVLAHPTFGSGRELITGRELEQRLKTLMSYGLKGVEAFYSAFSAEQRNELLTLAGKYDLYVTAGSDYHGRNKKIVPGETGMNSRTELPEGFRRFLRDVSIYNR